MANIYLAERMASAEGEPITGVWGQSPWWGVRGAKPPPWSWKGFTFWTCNGNSKLALQLSVFWKPGKPLLFVISLQNWGAIAAVESRCKATLFTRSNKKLSCRRGTTRCVVSIEILPIVTQQCRNYLYDKSWPNRRMRITRSYVTCTNNGTNGQKRLMDVQ